MCSCISGKKVNCAFNSSLHGPVTDYWCLIGALTQQNNLDADLDLRCRSARQECLHSAFTALLSFLIPIRPYRIRRSQSEKQQNYPQNRRKWASNSLWARILFSVLLLYFPFPFCCPCSQKTYRNYGHTRQKVNTGDACCLQQLYSYEITMSMEFLDVEVLLLGKIWICVCIERHISNQDYNFKS